MTGLMSIVALTVLSCVAIGLLGLGALHLVRRRGLGDQLAIATLLPVLTVVVAVIVNVRLMFISRHDSIVISVALLVSVLLAVLAAWLIRRRLARTSQLLGAEIGRLGTDGPPPDPAVEAPREFAAVLTELGETRQKLVEARAHEQQVEQARRELISFMSHDLRTPLAGLRAVTEGLEDGVIDDVPRALGQLRRTVDRMTVLVDDLFALSRLDEPLARPRSLFSVAELVTDQASPLEATAASHGVSVAAVVPATDRLAVVGSADDLTRAVANLTANAVRHTPSGGRVELSAHRGPGGSVAIAVSDGCGGIPEDQLARVFDTGWRGSSARGEDGGSGLGLAIAKGVVEAHHGAIGVRNVAGGCRFEITLPAGPTGDRPTG